MLHTQVEGTSALSGVPIVRDFLNVFSKDLPGMPPKRQFEFRIDLVPSTAPIANKVLRVGFNRVKILNRLSGLT